jgi:hypothetical protein
VDTFAVGLIGLRDSGIKPGSLALLGMTVLGLASLGMALGVHARSRLVSSVCVMEESSQDPSLRSG